MSIKKPTTLPIADIRIDGGTQARHTIDAVTVKEYCDAMKDGAEFPPIVVYFDGKHYWLADGFHRFHGAEQDGRSEILAEVREGTVRDAILHSVGANAAHGLRRTNTDKRHAVRIVLADAEWSGESNRWVADVCGVSHTMVNDMRSQVEESSTPASHDVEQVRMSEEDCCHDLTDHERLSLEHYELIISSGLATMVAMSGHAQAIADVTGKSHQEVCEQHGLVAGDNYLEWVDEMARIANSRGVRDYLSRMPEPEVMDNAVATMRAALHADVPAQMIVVYEDTVQRGSKRLIELMEAGEIELEPAHKIAVLPEEEQPDVIDDYLAA